MWSITELCAQDKKKMDFFVPFLYTLISELSETKSVKQYLFHLVHKCSFLQLLRERSMALQLTGRLMLIFRNLLQTGSTYIQEGIMQNKSKWPVLVCNRLSSSIQGVCKSSLSMLISHGCALMGCWVQQLGLLLLYWHQSEHHHPTPFSDGTRATNSPEQKLLVVSENTRR